MTVYPDAEPPEFGFERLLFAITGSAFASGMPFWLTWLREVYPDLSITVVLTRSAQQFVTRQALRLRTQEVLVDEWPIDAVKARHVEWAAEADAIVVYPATLNFTARLALGMGDSPLLLAAQCTSALTAVAPALPPGGLDSASFRGHWATLVRRPNVVMIAPQESYSLTTGGLDSWAPPSLIEVFRRLEARRRELAASKSRLDPPDIHDWRCL